MQPPRVPTSNLPGVTWPAVPAAAAVTRLALQYQLAESQWWPPETLLRHQFQQLSVLLAHAWKTVPFQRQRLKAAGIRPGRPIGPDEWERLPLLTRQDLQESGAALQSRQIPKGHGKAQTVASSGSTGTPVTTLITELTDFFWQVITLRNHLWHRRDLTKKFAAIRKFKNPATNYPQGRMTKSWGASAGLVFATGPSLSLSIAASVEQQVEWLQRQNPGYLLTFPSNLLQLATHCEQRGIAFPDLVHVLTMAEILSSEVRDACRQAWGVPVTDMYTAQEVGYIALQCPDHEHYHVQSEVALVEVLDDDGRACAPGEVGKVVVTALHNFAMPLVRYELGDYAEVGEPCPCGRGLPVLRRIVGRVRNTLVAPTGERYWPSFGSRRFAELAPIRQHQFVQKTLETIEARFVTERELTPEEEQKLREHILSRLPCPFELTFTYHDEIPRGAGGKYEDFLSEVAT